MAARGFSRELMTENHERRQPRVNSGKMSDPASKKNSDVVPRPTPKERGHHKTSKEGKKAQIHSTAPQESLSRIVLQEQITERDEKDDRGAQHECDRFSTTSSGQRLFNVPICHQ